MPRAVFAVVPAVLVLLTAVSFAQDKKDDKPPANLYPLAKGTKWEYEATAPGFRGTATAVVSAVSEPAKGERAVATVTTTQTGQTLVEELSADDKGVYRHAGGGQKFDPPVTILQYPVAAGAKWTSNIKVGGQEAKAEFKVLEPKKEKVKGVEYTLYPVVMTAQVSGLTVTATTSYADGVGPVKQEVKWGTNSTAMEVYKSDTELIKATPAGK